MSDNIESKNEQEFVDDVDMEREDTVKPSTEHNNKHHSELYDEALDRFGEDGVLDPKEERKLLRKIDLCVIPVLGICYFFYYVDKTTLSYAAIYGIKDDLHLVGTEYSLLSSVFYVGWVIWAIPSNLLMQKLGKPSYYLSFNIFMWGVLLACQTAVNNFGALVALRIFSGAFEAIADPAFMLFTSMYYTRAEQPSRISAWYLFNGIGVAGGGLIGYGIGNIPSTTLASWRLEFLIVGLVCAAWGISIALLLGNSPLTSRWFDREEKLMMLARIRRNQTGLEAKKINWKQIKEALMDYKTWMFFGLGFVSNLPNGGLSNFSTLIIQGLGFDKLHTALLGIPQGAFVCIWILMGAYLNGRIGDNKRTLVCMLFMLPTIAGALGFLLAPNDAYVGRLICFYLTGSYQASFVLALSLITSNTGGQSKKMVVSGTIWAGASIGNIVSPFFYITTQAPKYPLGIGSLLVANCLEFAMFGAFRYVYIWENRKKEKLRAEMEASGIVIPSITDTAFSDLTDKENPNFRYVY